METNTKELPTFDDLRTEELPVVEIFDMKEHALVFLGDKPYETKDKKHNKPLWIFTVEENTVKKSFMVSSIRLGIKLKKLSPLNGKAIIVKRINEGTNITDIDYEVSLVETKAPSA